MRRSGSSASSTAVAAAIASTARSTAACVDADTADNEPTLRTYCSAAARISSCVAGGSSPRSMVMLRHMPSPYAPPRAGVRRPPEPGRHRADFHPSHDRHRRPVHPDGRVHERDGDNGKRHDVGDRLSDDRTGADVGDDLPRLDIEGLDRFRGRFLSFALDPNFTSNRHVWAYYSMANPRRTVLVRYTRQPNTAASPASTTNTNGSPESTS